VADNIRIEQRKEPAAMQVYSGACGDALQSRRQFEIEKKIMFVEYLSNLSNAGALRAPALL